MLDEARSIALTDNISVMRRFILPNVDAHLGGTKIVVDPQPACNAYADKETNSIVICEGILRAFEFRVAVSLITARVKKWCDEGRHPTSDFDELKKIALPSRILSIHYLVGVDGLPDVTIQLGDDLKQDAFIAYSGGALFIVLHELAHLVLRHDASSPDEGGPAPMLAIEERLTRFKKREFEADEFAIQAIEPRAREAFLPSIWFLMGLYLDHELFLGGNSVSHPWTLNRIQRIQRVVSATEDPAGLKTLNDMFSSRLALMTERLAMAHPGEHIRPPYALKMARHKALLESIPAIDVCHAALDKLLTAYRSTLSG